MSLESCSKIEGTKKSKQEPFCEMKKNRKKLGLQLLQFLELLACSKLRLILHYLLNTTNIIHNLLKILDRYSCISLQLGKKDLIIGTPARYREAISMTKH